MVWEFFYDIFKITKWADVGSVPPSIGVIVNAAGLSAGFLTVITELIVVVVTKNVTIVLYDFEALSIPLLIMDDKILIAFKIKEYESYFNE